MRRERKAEKTDGRVGEEREREERREANGKEISKEGGRKGRKDGDAR